MLKNSELTINQGSNLKFKLGDQRYDQFSRLEFLRNRNSLKATKIKNSGINLNSDEFPKSQVNNPRKKQASIMPIDY